MDPHREARSSIDDPVMLFLRTQAPGLPTPRFDARTVTSRARRALFRRRLRTSTAAVAAAAIAYLGLALAGPLPLPGVGPVSVPGGDAIQSVAGDVLPIGPPGPGRRQTDVDRLETHVLPVAQHLQLSRYLLDPGDCRILEYARGRFSDRQCEELTPFDAQAQRDFDSVTAAVARSDLAVERINRQGDAIHLRLDDSSWQYNWEYVYLPGAATPPATSHPGEQWTRVRGDWWFHRAYDD